MNQDLENSLKEATSKSAWNVPNSQLAQIAQQTHDAGNCRAILQFCWNTIEDDRTDWRQDFKVLVLLEALLKHGSDKCVENIRAEMWRVQPWKEYRCMEQGRDVAGGIREKASILDALCNDQGLWQKEREKAQSLSQKMMGVVATARQNEPIPSGPACQPKVLPAPPLPPPAEPPPPLNSEDNVKPDVEPGDFGLSEADQNDAVERFCNVTLSSRAVAVTYLEHSKYNVERAADEYLADTSGENTRVNHDREECRREREQSIESERNRVEHGVIEDPIALDFPENGLNASGVSEIDQDRAVQKFCTATLSSLAVARIYLDRNNYNVEKAADEYLADESGAGVGADCEKKECSSEREELVQTVKALAEVSEAQAVELLARSGWDVDEAIDLHLQQGRDTNATRRQVLQPRRESQRSASPSSDCSSSSSSSSDSPPSAHSSHGDWNGGSLNSSQGFGPGGDGSGDGMGSFLGGGLEGGPFGSGQDVRPPSNVSIALGGQGKTFGKGDASGSSFNGNVGPPSYGVGSSNPQACPWGWQLQNQSFDINRSPYSWPPYGDQQNLGFGGPLNTSPIPFQPTMLALGGNPFAGSSQVNGWGGKANDHLSGKGGLQGENQLWAGGNSCLGGIGATPVGGGASVGQQCGNTGQGAGYRDPCSIGNADCFGGWK